MPAPYSAGCDERCSTMRVSSRECESANGVVIDNRVPTAAFRLPFLAKSWASPTSAFASAKRD